MTRDTYPAVSYAMLGKLCEAALDDYAAEREHADRLALALERIVNSGIWPDLDAAARLVLAEHILRRKEEETK